MQAMGNGVDDSFVGAIFPAGEDDWFAVVSFVKEGYIRDDDDAVSTETRLSYTLYDLGLLVFLALMAHDTHEMLGALR